MEQQCTKCKTIKDESLFYFDSKKPGKRRSKCKSCILLELKETKEDPKILTRRREIARNSAKKRRKESHHEYRQKENIRRKERYQTDLKFKEIAIRRACDRVKVKRKDPRYRALYNAKTRPSNFLRSKGQRYSVSLGCTWQELVKYIEALFQPGMSWANYGNRPGLWNIDHRYPISKAYQQGPDAFKKACHYTNLQPMWAIDNIRKSNKT